MMTNELKPCPFCGGEARTIEQHRWWVSCQECMCDLGFEGMDENGCYGHYDTEAEAIMAWNTRAGLTCRNECGRCSVCDAIMYDAPNYCPNCGAKVVE